MGIIGGTQQGDNGRSIADGDRDESGSIAPPAVIESCRRQSECSPGSVAPNQSKRTIRYLAQLIRPGKEFHTTDEAIAVSGLRSNRDVNGSHKTLAVRWSYQRHTGRLIAHHIDIDRSR